MLREYERYYKELLKIREPENLQEEKIELETEKIFEEMIKEERVCREEITSTVVEKGIKTMKKKRQVIKTTGKQSGLRKVERKW